MSYGQVKTIYQRTISFFTPQIKKKNSVIILFREESGGPDGGEKAQIGRVQAQEGQHQAVAPNSKVRVSGFLWIKYNKELSHTDIVLGSHFPMDSYVRLMVAQ